MTTSELALADRVRLLFEQGDDADRAVSRSVVAELREALSTGRARAAETDPSTPTGWRVNEWVKRGILLAFRCGDVVDVPNEGSALFFSDKDTLPLKRPDVSRGTRLVPGGSAIRDGAYVGRGVICMPPMYINIGAYVGDESLIDSHALIGSCAQIGCRVHVSAGAQIGGVIEPVGALPVIVEDDVLIGGQVGVYEGAVIKARAVLGAGTIVTGSTPVYDLVRNRVLRPEPGYPIVIPERAVVVPGARAVTKNPGLEWSLSIATPVIVKYRDDRTDARTALEPWIR